MAFDAVIDHTMLRVEDLKRSLEWYTDHLDYEVKRRSEHETFTLVFLGPENVHEDGALLELTYNHDGRSYDMGDAWGHVALRVRDVDSAYAALMESGVEDYRPPDENPGYAFVKDPDGHEIELVERDVGERFSIDHAMIRVEDVDRSIGWYVRKLGYEPTGRWEADTFANYFLSPQEAPPEAMSVELTYNYDGSTYDMGDGWGHLAVRCSDLESSWETLLDRGASDYRDPDSCDWNYAFTKDPDGHQIEIVVR